MRLLRPVPVILLLAVALLLPASTTTAVAPTARPATGRPTTGRPTVARTGSTSLVAATVTRRRPLAGKVIVIDPGHQLGNHNFPRKINRLVPAGDGKKACNTTGTATNGGYPEATFTWQVAQQVRSRLVALGARVILTRTTNSQKRWGPCVDVRGRRGNKIPANLELSIHGDGTFAPGAHGFHVIYASDVRPTRDTFVRSRRFARDVRNKLTQAGFHRSTYIGHGTGLDVRHDLGTLNLSNKPTCMVELGNMRNRRDARIMTSAKGRARYARALVAGMRTFLAR